jgi:hypothetical protein
VREASVEETCAIQSVLDHLSSSVAAVPRNKRVRGKSTQLALTDGPQGGIGEPLCAEHVQIMEKSLVALRGLAVDDHDQAHMFEVVGQPG